MDGHGASKAEELPWGNQWASPYPHSQTAKYNAILEHGAGDGEKESRKFPSCSIFLPAYLPQDLKPL